MNTNCIYIFIKNLYACKIWIENFKVNIRNKKFASFKHNFWNKQTGQHFKIPRNIKWIVYFWKSETQLRVDSIKSADCIIWYKNKIYYM